MPKSTTDPQRAQLLDVLDAVSNHVVKLRDFASVPGNAWLAKAELSTLMATISELEDLLESIKQSDHELGF
jgi:hypothetical protein